jgi:hypothetical protein
MMGMAPVMVGVILVAVAMVVVMPVTRAAFGSTGQHTVQIPGQEVFHRQARLAGDDFDALLCKHIQGAPAHAADNHNANPLLAQPAWENAGGVRWRSHRAHQENGLLLGINLGQRKMGAAAKMPVKTSALDGKSDGQA